MEALSFLTPLLPPRPLTHLQSSAKFRPLNHPRKFATITRKPRVPISLIYAPITPKFDSHKLRASKIESSQGQVSKYLNELAVKLVVGSLFLVGILSVRPAMACPPRTTVVMEEEATFEKLLDQEPENVDVLKAIVNGKMREGKMKEAVEYVERLIDFQPDEVEWRLLRALCYEIMGQLSKAQKLFKEILKDRPLLVRALHGLAMVMHKKGEDGALFEMLDKALQLASREKRVTEERNIMILIAQMHVVKGNLDDALKRFQELIDDNPRDFRPYLCQGIIYSLQDKKTEAQEQFEIYRSLVPEEFPQRGFLDDVVLAAKKETSANLRKEMNTQFSFKKKKFSGPKTAVI
ncbi:hypothetical protein V2J09_009753 [Rumex salicifolius]